MVEVFNTIDKIKNHFENNNFTNTVIFDDFSRVDLAKTTIFPLVHFWLSDVQVKGKTIEFSVDILALDILDHSKDAPIDQFYGNSNVQDILNTQLQVLMDFIKQVEDVRGDLAEGQLVLQNEPVCDVVYYEQENQLVGWGTTVELDVPNTMSIC